MRDRLGASKFWNAPVRNSGPRGKISIDKEWLRDKYVKEELPMKEIGGIVGCGVGTIHRRISELGIRRGCKEITTKHREVASSTAKEHLRKYVALVGFKKNDPRTWIREKAYENRACGENHWNWRGGIAKERDCISVSREYKNWRKDVMYRDGYMCQSCMTKSPRTLCAHHIIPFEICQEERFEVSNGMSLCRDCHIRIHKLEYGNINQYA